MKDNPLTEHILSRILLPAAFLIDDRSDAEGNLVGEYIPHPVGRLVRNALEKIDEDRRVDENHCPSRSPL